MTDRPYVVMWPRHAGNGSRRCEARGCETVIDPGDRLVLVVHDARWLRDPEARDAQAWLCGDCADRLGAKARTARLPETRLPPEPFVWRGKPLAAF